jgi:cytochrome d ubiquinol oxidase subunit I
MGYDVLSAFWILSVNSRMQTPQGYLINDVGKFVPEDWWAIIINPSFPNPWCTWRWRRI